MVDVRECGSGVSAGCRPWLEDRENVKLIALARAARARVGAREGAAVRDDTGRSHAAANVSRGPLVLSALVLALANSLASGADRIEAAAMVADHPRVGADDLAALGHAASPGTILVLCHADGEPAECVQVLRA